MILSESTNTPHPLVLNQKLLPTLYCFWFQSGRELTVKGIRALEYVGRETLDILASETGFDLETDEKGPEEETTGEVESYTEEVTFDRCFYIYGGPEHMEVSAFYS